MISVNSVGVMVLVYILPDLLGLCELIWWLVLGW